MGILSNAQAAQRFLAHDDVNLDEVREILADIVEDDKRCLLYTSDAADERSSVDLGGRRLIKKTTKKKQNN